MDSLGKLNGDKGLNIYITADHINLKTGGGIVTLHESVALFELTNLGEFQLWPGSRLKSEYDPQIKPNFQHSPDPWNFDDYMKDALDTQLANKPIKLAHVYSGTFSNTVKALKARGAIVTYTAAAHDLNESRKEHEVWGVPFNYPHLVDPGLWAKYVEGYLNSDLLICPSTHSAKVMRGFGYDKGIEIIPHGCQLPEVVKPLPSQFTLGYLGAIGPDKGLKYLVEAWKALGYRDGSKLVFAGKYSTEPWFMQTVYKMFNGESFHSWGDDKKTYKINGKNGEIHFWGWMENVADFYNNISAYCQPSVTEGFGIEVLEAASYARPVVCSTGAGASDVVPSVWTFPPRDVGEMANKIDLAKGMCRLMGGKPMLAWRDIAEKYTWDKVSKQYKRAWSNLLEA